MHGAFVKIDRVFFLLCLWMRQHYCY